MPLNDILSACQLSPDAEERFSKSMLKNLKGCVRINLGSMIAPLLLTGILGGLESVFFRLHSGVFGMLTLILYLLGAFLLIWELVSFRIEFDGSTGFVQYHTLFRGTTTYHADELMCFDVRTQHIYQYPSRSYIRRITLRTRELLQITAADGTITVPLSAAWRESKLVRGVGGYRDAEKFYNYLVLYQRYVYKSSLLLQASQEDALAPAVLAAIEETRRKAAFAPVPEHQSIPELTGEELAPGSATPEHSVPASEEPEQYPQFGFSDPVPDQRFPDPAQKPAVDVDKLFQDVLRQHGKL